MAVKLCWAVLSGLGFSCHELRMAGAERSEVTRGEVEVRLRLSIDIMISMYQIQTSETEIPPN